MDLTVSNTCMYGTEGIFLLLPTGACMYVHARTLKSQVLRGPTCIKIYIYFFVVFFLKYK